MLRGGGGEDFFRKKMRIRKAFSEACETPLRECYAMGISLRRPEIKAACKMRGEKTDGGVPLRMLSRGIAQAHKACIFSAGGVKVPNESMLGD